MPRHHRSTFRRTSAAGSAVVLAAAAATAVGLGATPARAVSPDLVISQVYGGGGNSGATLTNDFIELYNRGAAAVSVAGWAVQYSSATGATWQTTPLTGSVAAGAHYLVAEAAGSGGTTALPTPDATGTIALSGTAGKVALTTSTTALTCATGCATAAGVQDLIGFGPTATSFEGTGPAPAPSNTTADLRAAAGATDTDDNAADFTTGPPNPRTGAGGGGTTPPPPPVVAKIHDIQGAAHLSPLAGKPVTGVTGIVTARASNGYYLQDPVPDSDPATSEGIFVFTGTAPTVPVGDAVSVAGTVSEFRSGGATSTGLTTTEIDTPTTTVVSAGHPLPAATVIGAGGRIPPDTIIENDSSGDVETSGTFDPAQDGIDFYESLEGMRVQVNKAVAVGPTNSFGETPVIGDNGRYASGRSYRGGVIYREGIDANPERIIIDDALGVSTPTVNVDAKATSPIVGIMNYAFSNPMLSVTAVPAFTASTITRDTVKVPNAKFLRVATFNVENLAPGDPDSKYGKLAGIITGNLASPDVLAIEEIQDDSGATDDGVVTAGTTWAKLIAAIAAAGGPTYSYTSIDPVNDQDGGQPGGNIRVGFLYNPARGVALAAGAPAGDPTTAETVVGAAGTPHLALNPGRIAPADPAWTTSRKPLAGEFTWHGKTVFIIANHFDSKGGDDPLYGHFQPPKQPSRVQRVQQATVERAFLDQILGSDPNANVIVAGDLNDYDGSPPLVTLAGSDLLDLPSTLALNKRYTYVFEGNSEVLDHILLSPAARAKYQYQVVHVNSEFADQASDHDPQVVSVNIG